MSARALAIALGTAAAIALVMGLAPRPGAIVAALAGVSWTWMGLALLANAASIVVRAEAWRLLMTRPGREIRPSRLTCLSAYSVGLLGNTLLPARVGEPARVVVASRHLAPSPQRATLVAGSVLAQRCLDVAFFVALVALVLGSGQAPGWVVAGTLAVAGGGLAAVAAGIAVSRRASVYDASRLLRPVRWLVAAIGDGFAVLSEPRLVARAGALQAAGWIAQLLVVDLTLRAFATPVPLVASALVLVLLNGILAFPLWPGGVGAYQALVALALVPFGVASTSGLGLGLGLQAVESLVGVGFGLAFVAHEGLSLATLRRRGAGAP